MVLRHRANAGQHAREREPCSTTRMPAIATKWLYAPDLEPTGILRPDVGEHQRTPDLAGDAAQQDRRLLGRAVGLPEVRGQHDRHHDSAGGLARGERPKPTLPLRVPQVTWTSPVTNRLLLDAGFGGTYYGWGNFERDPNPTRDLIKVTEQCATGCAANGNRPGIVYRSQDWGDNRTGSYIWKASTWPTSPARHSFKVGYQRTLMTDDRTWSTNSKDLWYRFNNGMPNQLTQTISPWINDARAGWDAVFAQEQWTMGRLTLQGALRFDIAESWFPEQNIGPDTLPAGGLPLPGDQGHRQLQGHHAAVRLAYDVFGNGRTAVKMNIGKYLEGVGVQLNYANTNPTLRIPTIDRPVRRAGCHAEPGSTRTANLVARLRPRQPAGARQCRGGQRRRRSDFCGQISNRAVWPAGPDRQLRSGSPQRVGRACGGLELWRLGPAAAPAAHVARSRLLPAIVRRLHHERQPRAGSRAT